MGTDCGIHVLLYIERFGSNGISNISEADVLEYRKKLTQEILMLKNADKPNKKQMKTVKKKQMKTAGG
ncbi:hypothetical protein ACP70R_019355 [Stipagrostis hirtigluma subsp. patula]